MSLPEEPRAGSARVGLAAEARAVMRRARPIPVAPEPAHARVPQPSLRGSDGDGYIAVRGPEAAEWTLLLFLSPSCLGCEDLWALVRRGVDGIRVVGITKPTSGDERVEVARLAGEGETLASAEAWSDYRVLGAPFWVLVQRDPPTVVAEGVAIDGGGLERQVQGFVASGSPSKGAGEHDVGRSAGDGVGRD